MGKRKFIIAATIFSMLGTAINVANADTINSLLQMDVKKSSVADTVDVTFYTTGNSQNSVVTRKSNNRYVVLLPGTSSTASVAPGIGGVKDLITDIDVKHVNDGMGGYTKVTFGTTKPINIKTHMQKTNPLTQAQKDSQAIIAKNNAVSTQPAKSQQQTQTQVKPVSNTTQTKTAQNSNNTQPKTAVQAQAAKTQSAVQKTSIPEKLAQAPKIIPMEFPKSKISQLKPKAEKPKVEKIVESKVQEKPIQTQTKAQTPTVSADDGYVPKMKFDENGKRLIDLEPRVSHKIVQEKPAETAEDTIQIVEEDIQPQIETETIPAPIAEEMPQTQEESTSHFPIWILLAGGAVLALGIMYLVVDAFLHANKKDKSRLESFHNMSVQNQAKRRRREYYDIVNNKDLNWQEKYKLYSEKEQKRNQKKKNTDMSYITDMSGSKKAVVMPSQQVQSSVNTNVKPQEKTHDQVVREKLQAKISQMEHSLSQTPTMKVPENVSNEVKSEDTAIMNKMNDIKLKSFSKPTTLKETQRTLAEEEKEVSRNKSYKEGRFVKLKNSPLSVTLRKSVASGLEASDLIGAGNKYLTNNGVDKMNKEKENYLVSSLDEYLSILDTESTSPSAIAKPRISQAVTQKSSESQAMSRSGVTNPIAKASSPIESTGGKKPLPYMNGLIVKSGYNIDSEKGFYLVNMEGVSALVGRIKDNVFVLKKFDYVVDKPLQVRPDDANVYIVRVGKFKCLVDVSKDKMGTLIEI